MSERETPNLKDLVTLKPLVTKKYPFPNQNRYDIMIHGGKHTSKSTLALAAPGNILVFAYEDVDNILDPIKNFFDNDSRFQVKNFEQFMVEENGDNFKESCNLIYDLSIKLLKIAISKKIKFDWVVVDGYENMATIANMKMRYKNDVGAFAGVKNRNIWNERKLYLNEFFRQLRKVSKYGVIFTSQDVSIQKDDGKYSEPSWMGKTKNDIKTLVYNSVVPRQLGSKTKNSYFANILGCKVSGLSEQIEITIKVDKNGNVINSPMKFWERLLTSKATVKLKWSNTQK